MGVKKNNSKIRGHVMKKRREETVFGATLDCGRRVGAYRASNLQRQAVHSCNPIQSP